MFLVYLVTQGVNPKEHPVKQELVRYFRYYLTKLALSSLLILIFMQAKVILIQVLLSV